jgi:hypothetical protein
MTSSQGEYPKLLGQYLLELKALTKSEVSSDSLSSPDELEELRQSYKRIQEGKEVKITFPFRDRKSIYFQEFIKKLHESNSSPIYIWTEESNLFGLFTANSIRDIDFTFSFDLNPSGVLVFLTRDLRDVMLFDYYYDSKGEETIDMTLGGQNWSNITYELRA